MCDKIKYFLKINKIPNLLIYGSSGVGKKTIVKNFLNELYKTDEEKQKYVLNINCGDGMGIKLIREELKFFGKTVVEKKLIKIIVLYNGDKLTCDAQCALRRCIEIYSKNTRFIIIVENKNNLMKPLISRFCEVFICSDKNNYENLKIDSIDNGEIEEIIFSKKNLFDITEELYDLGYNIFDLIHYFKLKNKDKNKNYYLFFIDIFRKNVLNEKIIIYFAIYLLKMRPSIELFNINSY